MNKNTAGPAEPIYDSRNSDEPPRMSDKCPHGWTTPPECPSCMAMELDALRDNNLTLNVVNERLSCEIGNLKIELESLRQENSRLREALCYNRKRHHRHCVCPYCKSIDEALNPPKRS